MWCCKKSEVKSGRPQSSNEPDKKSRSGKWGGIGMMFYVFGIIAALFASVIWFSYHMMPNPVPHEYETIRRGISDNYRDAIAIMDMKHSCRIDSLRFADNALFTAKQKKHKADSISKEMRLVDMRLWHNQLNIDSLLKLSDNIAANNLERQVRHMEAINGWWVAILAAVATLVALCLAIQQNAGYREQKAAIEKSLEEMEDSVRKMKFLKSVQLLETISALCAYTSRTEDKHDMFRQIRMLIERARNRFDDFTKTEEGKKNWEEYRAPLIMILQQMEIIYSVLKYRLTCPEAILMTQVRMARIKACRNKLCGQEDVTEKDFREALTLIDASMVRLLDVLDEETPRSDEGR